MSDYGLTTTGFVPKTLEVCLDEIKSRLRTSFGQSLRLDDNTIDGQIAAIYADREASLWELAEAVSHLFDPDSVVAAQQDRLCALTGTIRNEAVASSVALTLTGTATTTVPAGSQARVASTAGVFATDADATIAAVSAWAGTTAYVAGDRAAHGGYVWQCTVAGTSAGSGGPDATGLDPGDTYTDNTVTWLLLGAGDGAVDAAATASETGPIVAVAGDLTVIETPVAGWEAVYNVLDADVGRDLETSEALRVRREQELAASGSAPHDAIRADILEVAGVTACRVFSNRTDTTDVDGVPPHSVEVLVQGGDDQDIFDQLLASVADGIGFHGTVTGTSTDSEGTDVTVKFSRPDEIEIYIDVTLTKAPDTYEGDAAVKAAIVAAGDAGVTGFDTVASRISSWVFGVGGVLDVSAVLIGTAPAPASSMTIPISLREIATYDTSRITVTSADGTP